MSDNLHLAQGEPPWATLLIHEVRELRKDVAGLTGDVADLTDEVGELQKDVKGGGTLPGHAEQLRDHDKRLTKLEALVKWVAGIGTAFITAVGSAWALFAGGPHK